MQTGACRGARSGAPLAGWKKLVVPSSVCSSESVPAARMYTLPTGLDSAVAGDVAT